MSAPRITPDQLESVFNDGPKRSGALISIVGFDGSGKTTQIEALAERFRTAGHEVLVTRQPTDWYRNEGSVQQFHDAGGSRERARILSLFAAADRHRHVQEVILPALSKGQVVLCDRYVYATFGVFIHRGVDAEFLATINRGIPRPDHAFYLDVPTAILSRRLRERDGLNLKFEERSDERIESITSTYREMGAHLERVDGSLPVQEVSDDLWRRCGALQKVLTPVL
ncbi:dTMP kinase [Variovorax sp. Varisp62]|uniref:dTMP kinase n=1 Tax=Variovorax sp. Varisp62 TaxID=3243049 RepID=UPI0039B6D6E9